ncbi:hypothetical protein GCM10009834_37530 [Streptomonospora arabica]|uniref:Uncharacterized protein n=1 Tax=Streptomonospora halophila TaxID=427369 RepID=A0ABP9G5I0_9ACTN
MRLITAITAWLPGPNSRPRRRSTPPGAASSLIAPRCCPCARVPVRPPAAPPPLRRGRVPAAKPLAAGTTEIRARGRSAQAAGAASPP